MRIFLTLLLPESMLMSMGCATTRDHIWIHGPTVAGSLCKKLLDASEMVHQIKDLGLEPSQLSPTPGTLRGERENQLQQVVF